MTTITYDHVIDDTVRTVLLGTYDEQSLPYALNHTAQCLNEDATNPDVDLTVLDARIDAYNRAHDALHDEGDTEACLNNLRACWLI